MTSRIAFFLALAVIIAVAGDLAYGWGGTLFLMRKLDGLVNWTAFWR